MGNYSPISTKLWGVLNSTDLLSMLGEIIKSTEALRYHAKTAEIAGQNLAHVNDETYARQRVLLAKEGLMS